MATFTEVLPERKSSKRSAMNWTPDLQKPGSGELSITTKRCHCTYRVTRFATDFHGSAFHFEKNKDEAYDVFVGPREALCDCTGFLAHGHCKHTDAARAILDNGWDTMSLVNPDADVGGTEAPF